MEKGDIGAGTLRHMLMVTDDVGMPVEETTTARRGVLRRKVDVNKRVLDQLVAAQVWQMLQRYSGFLVADLVLIGASEEDLEAVREYLDREGGHPYREVHRAESHQALARSIAMRMDVIGVFSDVPGAYGSRAADPGRAL